MENGVGGRDNKTINVMGHVKFRMHTIHDWQQSVFIERKIRGGVSVVNRMKAQENYRAYDFYM